MHKFRGMVKRRVLAGKSFVANSPRPKSPLPNSKRSGFSDKPASAASSAKVLAAALLLTSADLTGQIGLPVGSFVLGSVLLSNEFTWRVMDRKVRACKGLKGALDDASRGTDVQAIVRSTCFDKRWFIECSTKGAGNNISWRDVPYGAFVLTKIKPNGWIYKDCFP